MNYIDYRKRLGIGFNETEVASLFLTRMNNHLEHIQSCGTYDHVLRPQMLFDYCNITGAEYGNMDSSYCLDSIIDDIATESTLLEFLAKYSVLLTLLKKASEDTWAFFWGVLADNLVESRIQFDVFEDADGYFVFPKGAKELDDALVSQPLEWLSAYPQTQKTFVIALRQYSDGIYIRDVADNLRKALEAFFQEFLGNTKNLETNKNEICKYLGAQGVDAGISGLFQPLINAYKNINDRIAKHNDAVDKKLLEFLLYQTGVLIRMVIVVKAEEKTNET